MVFLPDKHRIAVTLSDITLHCFAVEGGGRAQSSLFYFKKLMRELHRIKEFPFLFLIFVKRETLIIMSAGSW